MAAPDSLPAAASGCVRSPVFWFGLNCVCFVALYWGLRIGYWRGTSEAPFSDMAGYVTTADNIVLHGFWGLNNQLRSYYTPVTPAVIAIAKLLSKDHFHGVYQVLVAGLNFLAIVLAGREIARLTGRRSLGWLFCYVVALAKPSIFWSLKLATEGPAEALIHLNLGLALWALRSRSRGLCFASGAAFLLLGLNRPQYMAGLPLLALFYSVGPDAHATVQAVRELVRMRGPEPLAARACRAVRSQIWVALFLCGFVAAWTPWLVRTYRQYGAVMPTSSSGACAILWEFGGTPVRIGKYTRAEGPNGVFFTPNGIENRKQIGEFPDDYQFSIYMRALSVRWLRLNARELPMLFLARLRHMISKSGASGLTKVSREQLFNADCTGVNLPYTGESWLNLLLLDKNATVCLLALGGLVALWRRHRQAALLFAALAACPWVPAVLTVGYERMVEPMIPLMLWLSVFCVFACFSWHRGTQSS